MAYNETKPSDIYWDVQNLSNNGLLRMMMAFGFDDPHEIIERCKRATNYTIAETKEFAERTGYQYDEMEEFNASTKKSKIKKDRDIWSKIDVLKAELGCDRMIEETYHALSTDVANETLDYIAKNWDVDFEYNDYEASAKKSKSFNEMVKQQRIAYKNKKVL